MTIASETILSTTTHTGDSSPSTVTSNAFKGDGFYGRSDGLHTIQIDITDFIGKIEIQGSLEVNPTDNDWFVVEIGTGNLSMDTTGLISEQNISYIEYLESTSNSKTYNFIGNFVWVRAKVTNWTDGTINSIRLNH